MNKNQFHDHSNWWKPHVSVNILQFPRFPIGICSKTLSKHIPISDAILDELMRRTRSSSIASEANFRVVVSLDEISSAGWSIYTEIQYSDSKTSKPSNLSMRKMPNHQTQRGKEHHQTLEDKFDIFTWSSPISTQFLDNRHLFRHFALQLQFRTKRAHTWVLSASLKLVWYSSPASALWSSTEKVFLQTTLTRYFGRLVCGIWIGLPVFSWDIDICS